MATVSFYRETEKPYGAFSNYYESPFVVDGVRYKTVEHFYQSSKFLDPTYRRLVASQNTPNKARILAGQKKGGGYKWRTDLNPLIAEGLARGVAIRRDWEDVKVSVMVDGILHKLRAHKKILRLLLDTASATIEEANPSDYFWSVGKTRKGKNMLGIVLRCVRDVIRRKGLL